MEIEFDPAKDDVNRKKHGISLARAAGLDLSAARIIPDDRRDYGELRFSAMVEIEGRLHVLIFTTRGDIIRPISLRRANDREKRQYDDG